MEWNPYLDKFLKLTKRLAKIDFFIGNAELNKTEFRLFQEVIEEREKGRKIISSELARRLGVTRSAISQIVTKLEQKNVVKRTPSPTDRKIAYVELSDYAAESFEAQCERANRFVQTVVEQFGVERMDRFFAECDALTAAFEQVQREN